MPMRTSPANQQICDTILDCRNSDQYFYITWRHAEGAVEELGQNVPAKQEAHAEDPVPGWKFPGVQLVQPGAPTPLANEPEGQKLQPVPPLDA